jgi:formiminotetrahydrofolate cyclodeaminase
VTDGNTGAGRTIAGYLNVLSSGDPTPGGGSAAAYTAALGVSLIAMVARLTKSVDPDQMIALESIAKIADRLRDSLTRCAEVDEGVYGAYRAAADLPKTTDAEKVDRMTAMQAALRAAAETPIQTASMAATALDLAGECARIGTKHALSDIQTAKHLMHAAIDGAFENVHANLATLKDSAVRDQLVAQVQIIQARVGDADLALETALKSRRQ